LARLFITSRELDLISDLTKEVIKDVSGQKLFYYRVREDLSKVHDVYDESQEKVFDPPIEIEARLEWMNSSTRTDKFGVDYKTTTKAFVHYRDLLDKNIVPRIGDFYSYGSSFYEIIHVNEISKIFGQVEHPTGVEFMGEYARNGLIGKNPLGPTSENLTEEEAIQRTFAQQRGEKENILGPTNDRRELIEKGVLDKAITGPRKITDDSLGFSFYGDDEP
jgi:hypothetical protein